MHMLYTYILIICVHMCVLWCVCLCCDVSMLYCYVVWCAVLCCVVLCCTTILYDVYCTTKLSVQFFNTVNMHTIIQSLMYAY